MTIIDRFNRDGVEPTLHNFCAVLQDTLADNGHNHVVKWENATQGCINILIGNVECYTLFPNNNSWIVTYNR
jgi:hypothetical protein